MTVAVLGRYDEHNLISDRVMRASRRIPGRRHYKKDSRFVLDLYTLTYDSHESLDSLGDLANRRHDSLSLQNPSNNPNLRNGKNNSTYRHRRPSLQSRIQYGKNMQVYFVNDRLIETEDSYVEDGMFSLPAIPQSNYALHNTDLISLPVEAVPGRANEPSSLNDAFASDNNNNNNNNNNNSKTNPVCSINNNARCLMNINCKNETARLSAPRQDVCSPSVLNNLKLESQRQRSDSPITCTIKASLKKVGAESGNSDCGRQRMSRHMLTKMNADQLQVIINDLHVHVEYLNEQLMTMLMDRDELHMKRDSLLVDIEDVSAYLDAKQVYRKDDIKLMNHLNENYIRNNRRTNNVAGSCAKSLISGLRLLRI